MVSLWGSKKADAQANGSNGEASQQPPTQHSDANERTRLLPPAAQARDGFLSPDDPAVSPYNLWSVRLMRYLSVFFLLIAFVWWALLLVSIFVSPPGMHARGSGFFDFSYACLATGILLVVLLFFSSPSRAEQIICLTIALLLLADVLIIVCSPQIRKEEGWVGIASAIWALFIAIWTVLTDRVVAYGKREEEERLTGRVETRRTLREWCSVLTSTIILIIMAIVVVLLSATLILRARDSSLVPPGIRYFVDGDKYQIHLFCTGDELDPYGKKVTTVLFEAGERPFENGLLEFANNALKNGTISRFCYADRPGIAFSDNAPSPFSAGMAADHLSEALARAGETGPWVLASAGVGSIYSRVFSARKGADVTGLLLIDPLHEDLLYQLADPRRGFLLWLRGVLSPLGIDRTFGAIFKGRSREDRVYGQSAYQGGKFIKAKLQESLVADSLTKNEVGSARAIQDPTTPLVLISSGIEVKKDSTWETKQHDLTHLTGALVSWDVIAKAPHEVWETAEGRRVIEKRLGALVI